MRGRGQQTRSGSGDTNRSSRGGSGSTVSSTWRRINDGTHNNHYDRRTRLVEEEERKGKGGNMRKLLALVLLVPGVWLHRRRVSLFC